MESKCNKDKKKKKKVDGKSQKLNRHVKWSIIFKDPLLHAASQEAVTGIFFFRFCLLILYQLKVLTPRSWLLFRTIFFLLFNHNYNGFHWIYYEINIKCHLGHLLFSDSFRVVFSFHWHFNLFKKSSMHILLSLDRSLAIYLSAQIESKRERLNKRREVIYSSPVLQLLTQMSIT